MSYLVKMRPWVLKMPVWFVALALETLKPGDRVMAIKAGVYTTHAIVPKKLCVQILCNLSFDDAAAMATVFSTTVESFFNAVHLEKGQVST